MPDFGEWQLDLAIDLMSAAKNGWPDDFELSGVNIYYNPNSGVVFASNSEAQVVIEENGYLYSFYTTPYDGKEGTAEDLLNDYKQFPESWTEEDVEYLREICEINDIDFE